MRGFVATASATSEKCRIPSYVVAYRQNRGACESRPFGRWSDNSFYFSKLARAPSSYCGGPTLTIIQPKLDVPLLIEQGLLAGKYVREGSVVRDAVSKQIVKQLKEVSGTGERVEKMASTAARLKWMPGKSTTIVLVSVGVAGVAGVAATRVIHGVKKRAERNIALPGCVRDFGDSWEKYRDAIRGQRLNVEILDQFISSLDALLGCAEEHGIIPLDLGTEQGAALANFVAVYTAELADANSAHLANREKIGWRQGTNQDSRRDVVVNLRRNLAVQRKIFGDAA